MHCPSIAFSLNVLVLIYLADGTLSHQHHHQSTKATQVPNENVNPSRKFPDKVDLSNLNFTDGESTVNKTRMLFYEYLMVSETVLMDEKSANKTKLLSKINATYAFEIIHYDKNGDILARYRLLKCNSGPCNYAMPVIYVDFIQGGNNIIGIFASHDDSTTTIKQTWNILLSVVNIINTPAISGNGDEQNVLTPFGLCHYRFWKPEDKKFKRRISNCHLDGIRNHTLIHGATVHRYEQTVLYVQNMKVDADIVYVEAEETLQLSSPLSGVLDLKVYSKTTLEVLTRNRVFENRLCERDDTGSECAEKSLGAIRLGRNWKEVRQNLQMGIARRASKVETIMEKYRKYMKIDDDDDDESMSGGQHNSDDALLFGELTNAIQIASKDELKAFVKQPSNRPLLSVFANALGSAGTLVAHRLARDVLLVDEPHLSGRYLESLALTTKINDAVIDDLKEWLAEEIKLENLKVTKVKKSDEERSDEQQQNADEDEDDDFEEEEEYRKKVDDEVKLLKRQIAFTLASLLHRHCESSISRQYACNNQNDKNVNEFIVSQTTKCNETECHRNVLQILMNIPIASVVPYASQFICSQANATLVLQKAALRLLSLVDAKFIETPVINRLLRIFRNTCPWPQSTTDQTLAIDVLMNAVPQHASVGTYLLRAESMKPDNHEKWAYFYESVAQRRLVDEKVDKYWSGMRRFRLFRPNYLHRSLLASSNVFGIKIAERGNYAIRSLSKTEFNEGIFKRSDFTLSIQHSNGQQQSPVLGITTDTAGLADFIASTDNSHSDSETHSPENPEASVQLSLFSTRLPPVKVFEGYTQLISAVWNADGSTIEGHDTNLIWRQYVSVIPLLSGITLTNDIVGSASIRLTGSSLISVWNRVSSSQMITNVSASLDAKLTISTPSGIIGDLTSRSSVSSSVALNLDVDFYTEPYLFCTVVSQGPLRFRQSISYLLGSTGKRESKAHTLTVPGYSFALNDRTTKMCNEMLQEH